MLGLKDIVKREEEKKNNAKIIEEYFKTGIQKDFYSFLKENESEIESVGYTFSISKQKSEYDNLVICIYPINYIKEGVFNTKMEKYDDIDSKHFSNFPYYIKIGATFNKNVYIGIANYANKGNFKPYDRKDFSFDFNKRNSSVYKHKVFTSWLKYAISLWEKRN